jgi:hypothetical protein
MAPLFEEAPIEASRASNRPFRPARMISSRAKRPTVYDEVAGLYPKLILRQRHQRENSPFEVVLGDNELNHAICRRNANSSLA